MAYTRVWNALAPSPNRPGGQLDDSIRELRTDLGERFDSVLTGIGDWDADPVVSTRTYYQYVHWSAFDQLNKPWGGMARDVANPGTWTALQSDGIGTVGSATTVLAAPIILPASSTLVDVEITYYNNTVGINITGTVYVVDATGISPTRTSLASRALNGITSRQHYSLSSGANINRVLDHTKNEYYFIELSFANPGAGEFTQSFHGARVIYSRHPLRYV